MLRTVLPSSRFRRGEEVTDAVDSCSREDVLRRLSVRGRDVCVGRGTGRVRQSSESVQKSADCVGVMGLISTVSRLLLDDSRL